MSNVRTCGAPKPYNRITCESCTCNGEQDVQRIAKNTLRAIGALERMQEGGIEIVKIAPVIKLLKKEE